MTVMTKMTSADASSWRYVTAVEAKNDIREDIVVNEGESYFCGTVTYDDGTEAMPEGDARQHWVDGTKQTINACIKAFTVEETETPAAEGLELSESNFPDATFLAYLTRFDTNGDNSLSTSEIAAIAILDLTNQNISDLTGIKNFTSLTSLKLKGNSITEIDITCFPNLKWQNVECDEGVVIINDTTAGEQPRFAYNSLMLGGQIGVNFYMYLPDSEDCWVSFDIGGKRLCAPQPVDQKITKVSGDVTYYGFRCYINSIQMADTITAVFTKGSQTLLIKPYSANKYLKSDFSTDAEETRNLISAIRDYGHYAQIMLDAEHSEWKLGEDHVAMEKGRASDYTSDEIKTVSEDVKQYALVNGNTGDTGIKAVNHSLNLDSTTKINVYLTVSSDYSGRVEAYLGGSDQNSAVKLPDGRYRIQIDNIPAHKLADTYTVHVSANTKFDIEISAMSYVNAVLNDGTNDTDLYNAVTALYHYCKTTAAYRDKNGYTD